MSIGPGVVIRGDRIRIGRGASIGALTLIAVKHIEIGEDARIDDRVHVASGGATASAAFHLGAFTILMRHSYVNCAHEVTIGDGTGVGGHCLLFTHGYWLNWFQGYPRQLAPIRLGKDVWLPWRVFVMPGATIGDGTVIGANSLVQGTIPPGVLAAGSPAKVVGDRRYAGHLAPEQVAARLEEFLDDLFAKLATLGVPVRGWGVTGPDGQRREVRVLGPGAAVPPVDRWSPEDAVVSLVPLDAGWRAAAGAARLSWFDLTAWERSDHQNPLGHELVVHFHSYGARFRRC